MPGSANPYSGNSYTSKVEIYTRPKLLPFARYVARAKLFCLKSFVPVTGLECSYGKIFIPVTEILGRKKRDLGNRASPASHMNTSIFLQRKEWPGEISDEETLSTVFFFTCLPLYGPSIPRKYSIFIQQLYLFHLRKIFPENP